MPRSPKWKDTSVPSHSTPRATVCRWSSPRRRSPGTGRSTSSSICAPSPPSNTRCFRRATSRRVVTRRRSRRRSSRRRASSASSRSPATSATTRTSARTARPASAGARAVSTPAPPARSARSASAWRSIRTSARGRGVCASACPTGAITYAYPPPGDQLAALRAALVAYRDAGGRAPALLFHDAETGAGEWARVAHEAPESVIPWLVEEIGSIGMDAWTACIAWGARVVMYAPEQVPGSVRRELDTQIDVTRAILEAMGYPASLLTLVADGEALGLALAPPAAPGPATDPPATFAPSGEKRSAVRLALDHLHEHAPRRPEVADLPPAAPFGTVSADRDACTLCMACVSVCPASALQAGGDEPRLSFIEMNCVQCGLCERACPESCITRARRYLFDREAPAPPAHPQRRPAVSLRELRQGVRHRLGGDADAGAACGPLHVPGAGRPGASPDVRGLPGQGHVQERGRGPGVRACRRIRTGDPPEIGQSRSRRRIGPPSSAGCRPAVEAISGLEIIPIKTACCTILHAGGQGGWACYGLFFADGLA